MQKSQLFLHNKTQKELTSSGYNKKGEKIRSYQPQITFQAEGTVIGAVLANNYDAFETNGEVSPVRFSNLKTTGSYVAKAQQVITYITIKTIPGTEYTLSGEVYNVFGLNQTVTVGVTDSDDNKLTSVYPKVYEKVNLTFVAISDTTKVYYSASAGGTTRSWLGLIFRNIAFVKSDAQIEEEGGLF